MNKGWFSTSLGDIAVVQTGAGFPKRYQGSSEGEFPFVKVGDMNLPGNERSIHTASNWISDTTRQMLHAKVFPEGSILFPKIGAAIATNKKRLVSTPCCADNNVIGLIPDSSQVTSEFLYYWLQRQDLSEFANDSNLPSMRKTTIEGFGLAVPRTLAEQEQIVAILDEAFAAIATASASAEENLNNARRLFESELNAVLCSTGNEWIERTLGDVCEIASKLVDPREPEYIDLPHVGAGNMVSRTGELVDVRTAREEKLRSGKFVFDSRMVLYSKIRPYLMKASRPSFEGLCSADVYPLLPTGPDISRDFLFYLLLSEHFTDYAVMGSARAGMPKVNREHLFAYRRALPSPDQQGHIAAKLDALADDTRRLESIYQVKSGALTELKQSILHKAFTGELTADFNAADVALSKGEI